MAPTAAARRPTPKVVSANIRPFERLPLCGIARIFPPVVFSHSVIHFQRSSGFSLWNVVYGSTWSALSLLSR
jgi:hypothetical protein